MSAVSDSLDTSANSAPDQPRVQFTRQLWERTMPNDNGRRVVLPGRFVSLGDSTNSKGQPTLPSALTFQQPPAQHQPTSPVRSLSPDSPITPDDPHPGSSGKKRRVDSVEQAEADTSPSHSRESSDGAFQPCLCQPEPKIPRPRNAFILYRQHHNSAVVAQNPGLANPGISKVIGELWRNESDEEKKKWKAYASAEKDQHQLKYPQYRYQPKRAVRRNSISSDSTPYPWSELRKCAKCGGRSIAQPSTPSSAALPKPKSTETSPTLDFPPPRRANTVQLPPPTPSSTTTPSTRYLPMLNNLSLSSPQGRRMGPGHPYGYPPLQREDDDRFPPTPDAKRRRFERPQGSYVPIVRAVPSRPGGGPGTPFPFLPQHTMTTIRPYPPGPNPHDIRRTSLPHATELIRGPPGQVNFACNMPPPPRPGMGYSQHRSARPGQDINLTLPPIQTANVPLRADYPSADSAVPSSGLATGIPDTRTAAEIIMAHPFHMKIDVLRRVAPPPPVVVGDGLRGAIVAVEGDDAEAAKELCDWLGDFLSRDKEVDIAVMEGPKFSHDQDGGPLEKKEMLDLAGEWHTKTKDILALIAPKTTEPNSRAASNDPHAVNDASAAIARKPSISDRSSNSGSGGSMELDTPVNAHAHPKTILLLRTYTLTASNTFATNSVIEDTYPPYDHWQWTATMWRSVAGPDITIYVKDVDVRDQVGAGHVEIRDDVAAMVIKRVKGAESGDKGGVNGIEAGALRRLGFEVGEWARGLGSGRSRLAHG